MTALRLLLSCVLGVCLVTAAPTTNATAGPTARVQCVLRDARIVEASGIAAGIVSPDVRYLQNDSGDSARFFAVDARTCASAATIVVAGAVNVDWEDIAVARDAAGVASVWLADVGDNAASRRSVAVYRVDEPRVPPGAAKLQLRVTVRARWRVRYAGGPADAESLAVAPGGAAYLITKSATGRSEVYRLPSSPAKSTAGAAQVQTLRPVGEIRFDQLASRAPFGLAGTTFGRLATGAAISSDGTELVVRTYTDAYLWRVHDGDVPAALRDAPLRIALPLQPQGEGVDIVGGQLLLDSEGVHSAVWTVPIPSVRSTATTHSGPAVATAPRDAVASDRGMTTATPAVAARATRTTAAASSSSGRSTGHGGSWLPGLIVLGLLLVGSAAWWTGQRGRRR